MPVLMAGKLLLVVLKPIHVRPPVKTRMQLPKNLNGCPTINSSTGKSTMNVRVNITSSMRLLRR